MVRPVRLRSLGLYTRRSSGLLLFTPGPLPVGRAGTHDDVPAIEWLCNLATAHIHTPSCTQQDAVFQGFVTRLTLTTHSSQIAYSQQAPFLSDWWLPSAAVNDLEPLPPSRHLGMLIESLLLAPSAQSHWLHSAVHSTSPHATLGELHTCQSGFGLAIRLVVGGLSPSTLPHHLS